MNPMADSYENRYFEQLATNIEGIKRDLRTNSRKTDQVLAVATEAKDQATKTNGKLAEVRRDVDELQAEVFKVENISDLPKWHQDPKFLSVAKWFFISLVITVAAVVLLTRGINLLEGVF